MSYSFYEVLPYLLTKQYGSLCFHYDFFKDIIENEDDLKELKKLCNELVHAQGTSFPTFKIPAFTRGDKTFESKQFNIENNGNEGKILDSCYEGKTYYHYTTYLEDIDSEEKMILTSNYYAATDRDLVSIDIRLDENEDIDEIEEDSSFVLMQVNYPSFQIYGVFSSLENALEAWKEAKAVGIIKNNKGVQIEEIPANKLLIQEPSIEQKNILRDCKAVYNSKGKMTKI